MRFNPFAKYLGPEDHVQHAVIEYIRLQYPSVLSWHTPNEGKRTPFERFKAKWLGITKGVSDLFLVCGGRMLALELKAGKNKPTDDQLWFIGEIQKHGFSACYATGFDEAKEKIDLWMKI